jgi:hypothetical protein
MNKVLTNDINLKKFKQDSEKWNQWFAGIADGDGCFYINTKEKSISFEVTTHITDARALYDIKNKLKGGTVRLRSGSQSVRYRVKAKNIIIDIINRLNGKLYNQKRIAQFNQSCELLKILVIPGSLSLAPVGSKGSISYPSLSLVDTKNAYLSGMIDSDGSITISVSKSSAEDYQLSGVEGRTIRLINAMLEVLIKYL